MTLHTFSTDVVPIIQIVFTALGLISLFLLWLQIRQANLWNKLKSEHNFMQQSHLDTQIELIEAGKEVNLNLKARNTPLTIEEIKIILDNDKVYFALSKKLNQFENICAAIRVGAADPELSYATHSSIVTMAYNTYTPFIEWLRERDDDDEIYIELQKVALEWKEKYLRTKHQQKRQIETLEKALCVAKGVCKKI